MIHAEGIWKASPEDLRPADRQIHMFRASLNKPLHRISCLARTLSTEERARAQRFHRDTDRQRFVASRGQLREILGAILQADPRSLMFEYGPFGKPRLASPRFGRSLHFNLSHAEALAVIAVAGEEVGVDVECLRPVPEALAIADRFFSRDEARLLQSLPLNAQIPAFFRCWTRTEALIKAAGTTFDDLQPGVLALDEALLSNGEEGLDGRWTLQSFEPAAGYVGAFATRLREPNLSWWEWA